MIDNTERYMVDNCGSLIDKKTHTYYYYMEEILPILNQQEEKINELENSKKQLKRVYNYFMDYLEDEMSSESFSEMWDFVIIDENWD